MCRMDQICSKHFTPISTLHLLAFLISYKVELFSPFYKWRKQWFKEHVTDIKRKWDLTPGHLVLGASLMTQWVKNPPAMHETWVQSPIWENPTCYGATNPTGHNYWACVLKPWSHNYWIPCALELVLCSLLRTHCNEKPIIKTTEKPMQQWRPNTTKNKINK